MEEIMKFASDNSWYIFIAVATSNIGAFARISYEKETKMITLRQSFKYYSAAWLVGYICFDSLLIYDLQRFTGLCCVLGGLISVNLVKIVIEQLPNVLLNIMTQMLPDFVKKMIDKKITDKNENDEII